MNEGQSWNPDGRRRPFDKSVDSDLREHGYIAVFRSSTHPDTIGRETVTICFGNAPAQQLRYDTPLKMAQRVEERDEKLVWLDEVPDPDELASDLRELYTAVKENRENDD